MVSILTVTSADGVVVRRRLLAAEGGANGRVAHVELHEAADGSLTAAMPSVAHAQRHLLQTAGDVDRVTDSFGNSGLLVTNEAVDPQLNLARLAGATNAWQFVTISVQKATAVPVQVFTQNARALLRAASSNLGAWVREATPVTFVPGLSANSVTVRRLLQYSATDKTFNVTGVLHLANINGDSYGTLRTSVLKCLFAQINDKITIIGAGALSDAVTQCSGTQLQAWMASHPTFVDAETVVIGECGNAAEYVGAERCMQALLNVTYDASIPDSNVEKLALETAKVQFQLSLGVDAALTQTDRAYEQTLRRVVSEAMRVAVDRIVIEFTSASTPARRLLQTATVATVWLYDYPKTASGAELSGDNLSAELGSNGDLQAALSTAAAETPLLQLNAEISGVTQSKIQPPRLPSYQWRVRVDVEQHKLTHAQAHGIGEVQMRINNAVAQIDTVLKNVNVEANRLWTAREHSPSTSVRETGENSYTLVAHVDVLTEERALAVFLRSELQAIIDDALLSLQHAIKNGVAEFDVDNIKVLLHGVETLLPGTGEVSGMGIGAIIAIVILIAVAIGVVVALVMGKKNTGTASNNSNDTITPLVSSEKTKNRRTLDNLNPLPPTPRNNSPPDERDVMEIPGGPKTLNIMRGVALRIPRKVR